MEGLGKPLPTGTPTLVAFARHPLHPMLVTFPIAFLIGALGSDLAFWQTEDTFWARVSLWLLGAGWVTGLVAGLAGTVELLCVSGIRRRPASWNHFVVAVMLLAVAFINWFSRLSDPIGTVLPLGVTLSGLGAMLVGAAGWLGGNLVFEHQIAIGQEDADDDDIDNAPISLNESAGGRVNLADESDR